MEFGVRECNAGVIVVGHAVGGVCGGGVTLFEFVVKGLEKLVEDEGGEYTT